MTRSSFITDLAAKMNNAYTHDLDVAEKAFRSGKPAFWAATNFNDSTTGGVVLCFNKFGGINEALEANQDADRIHCIVTHNIANNSFGRTDMTARTVLKCVLDRTIPLNHAAAEQMVDAYDTLGDFYEASDLMGRLYSQISETAQAA